MKMFVTNLQNQETPLEAPEMFPDQKPESDGPNVLREVGSGKETPLELPKMEFKNETSIKDIMSLHELKANMS